MLFPFSSRYIERWNPRKHLSLFGKLFIDATKLKWCPVECGVKNSRQGKNPMCLEYITTKLCPGDFNLLVGLQTIFSNQCIQNSNHYTSPLSPYECLKGSYIYNKTKCLFACCAKRKIIHVLNASKNLRVISDVSCWPSCKCHAVNVLVHNSELSYFLMAILKPRPW